MSKPLTTTKPISTITKRYQLLRHDRLGFVWTTHSTLPYKILAPMKFNDRLNKWDEPDLDLSKILRLYDIIDFRSKRRGTIYATSTSLRARHFVWWWQPERGLDFNPHVAACHWIELP